MERTQTSRHSQVLRFIQAFVDDNGYPPTYEEIRQAIGLSSRSHAAYYLSVLEDQGFIERTPYAPRALRLVRVPAGPFEIEGNHYTPAGN